MQQTTGNSISSTPETQGSTREAPPKQVAQAMDRLGLATRLIADIRLGADRLLEALIMAGQPLQSNSSKPLQFIIKEEASLRQSLQDLRTIGRQLEDSGVLNESLRSRSNSWGLHMPLVCPDGAVVAYAWKRQLAGQAGASAVDRTRLALKAFTDQKRLFFPHLDDDSGAESAPKRHCSTRTSTSSDQDEINDFRTVLDVLSRLEKEVPNVKTFTYRRLDWLKRASLLPSSSCETSAESLKEEHNFRGLDTLRQGLANAIAADQIAVIELLFPSVFRVVISLHPVGSLDPDAVAFFSPDEGGSYIHARGFSVFNVFKHITEHAAMALQHFTGIKAETALYMLLLWICSYENLFTRVCSKCGKLLSMDKESALLLPPVQRPYRNFSAIAQLVSSQQHSSTKDPNQMTMIRSTPSYTTSDQIINGVPAYHIGCFSEES